MATFYAYFDSFSVCLVVQLLSLSTFFLKRNRLYTTTGQAFTFLVLLSLFTFETSLFYIKICLFLSEKWSFRQIIASSSFIYLENWLTESFESSWRCNWEVVECSSSISFVTASFHGLFQPISFLWRMGSVWSSSSIIKLWPNSTFVCIRWSEGRVERKKKYSLKQDLSSEENDSAISFLGLLDQLGIGWCIWKKCSNHSRGHFGFYRIELKYFGFCISKETTLKDWFSELFTNDFNTYWNIIHEIYFPNKCSSSLFLFSTMT